ncbi:hypothetical protein [Candidatus Methylopumilus universalis]|uniref:hypothetical protein n=1 Tax=Candidatus Methylopumilus universalis TaxID=2588536 RepID=UPI003BEEEFF2
MNKKKKLIIVGGAAGADIVFNIMKNYYEDILFCDSYSKKADANKLIKFEEFSNLVREDAVDYFIATGDNFRRSENYKKIRETTDKFPINVVHEKAFIDKTNISIGYGNLILAYSYININTVIKNCSIINTGAIVEHDCIVGNFSQISPNGTLGGYVEVGDCVFIGLGAVILPKIKIIESAIIGANTLVNINIDKPGTYVGSPARRIHEN